MAIAFYVEFPRITAVEISGTARKPKIKRVEVGDLPEPRNEDGTPIVDRQGYLNSQIAAFIKERKLYGGRQYLLAGPDAMRYRDMTLSFKDTRQIDRVLQYQVEGVIPNIPIEKLTIGYNILTRTPDGARLLVHAADKDYIRERLIALEEAGSSIHAVDSHLSGTLNLGLMHPELDKEKPPTLWIDFAGTTATVSVVNAGEVLTSRVFLSPYLAGATGVTAPADKSKDEARHAEAEAEMHARMTQEYVLLEKAEKEDADLEDMAEATLPKAESVNIGEEQVADRIKHMSRDELQKFIHRVSIEARRTLLMTNLEVEPERLLVSGLGDAGADITALLGNELQLEDALAIELLDVVTVAGKDERLPDVGELSYLTGVAIKGLGRDYSGIDFRYGDLAPGTLFDYAKTPLAFTATLVLLFCGILFLVAFTHARNYERDIEALRDQEYGPEYFFERAYQHTKAADKEAEPTKAELKLREYPGVEDSPGDEVRLVHTRLKEMQTRLEGEVAENYALPHPADQILAAVFKAIESGVPSYDFSLMQINISESVVTVDYMVSLAETQAERNQLKAGRSEEVDRMLEAFRTLVAENPQWFDGSPNQTVAGRPQTGPENRLMDKVTMRLNLKRIEAPKRPSAAGRRPGGRK